MYLYSQQVEWSYFKLGLRSASTCSITSVAIFAALHLKIAACAARQGQLSLEIWRRQDRSYDTQQARRRSTSLELAWICSQEWLTLHCTHEKNRCSCDAHSSLRHWIAQATGFNYGQRHLLQLLKLLRLSQYDGSYGWLGQRWTR